MSKTNYFNLWSLEREFCTYLYDVETFKNSRWFDDKIQHAIQIQNDSKRIIIERNIMKDHYTELIKKVGSLEYFKKMYELQDNIIKTAKERNEVASTYLKENGIVKIKFPWSIDC